MPDPVIPPVAPPVAPPVVPPVTPPAGSWFDPLDPVIRGTIQTRGWDKLEPPAAVAEAIKVVQEAEKVAGYPLDQMLRLPTDPKDEGWAAVHKRLGVPDDKAAYGLTGLKFADGETLDEGFAARLHDVAHEAKLRPEQATAVVTEFMKFLDESDALEERATRDAATVELEKLKNNWGPNFDINEGIVNRTATKLGMSPEVIKILGSVTGGAATMEMILNLGRAMGEARFITGDNAAGIGGVLSVDQAQARMAELKNQASQRILSVKERTDMIEELDKLNLIIVRANHAQR